MIASSRVKRRRFPPSGRHFSAAVRARDDVIGEESTDPCDVARLTREKERLDDVRVRLT